ncbi:hypothetical protein BTVI_85033 [Pitangus sulphuratus]|nr:hypothetical protein BTVI_85033 [Pitangus sulphuratus]
MCKEFRAATLSTGSGKGSEQPAAILLATEGFSGQELSAIKESTIPAVSLTRHVAAPHRNSARQKQGVYRALKHPFPAVVYMCKEKGEIRSLVVPLHLKPIRVFRRKMLRAANGFHHLYAKDLILEALVSPGIKVYEK